MNFDPTERIKNGIQGKAVRPEVNEKITDVNKKITDVIKRNGLFYLLSKTSGLKNEIKQLTSQEFLDSLFATLLEDADFIENPLFYLDRLSDLMSLDEDEIKSIEESANSIEESTRYGEILKTEKGTLFYIYLYSWKVQNVVTDIFESLILRFSITHLFIKNTNSRHGNDKISLVFEYLGRVRTLTKLLVLFKISKETGAKYAFHLLIALAILSIIHPFIRKVGHLPHAICLDESIKNQAFSSLVVDSRKKIMDEIAKALEMGKYPLLIGESGVGKTQLVESFGQAVENGEYPFLSGKSFFYFNTADFSDFETSFTNDDYDDQFGAPLIRIQRAIGARSKNVVLVFDEIHSICLKSEGEGSLPSMGNNLKTVLDGRGRDPFRFFIAMTTLDEYKATIALDPPLDRRFTKIQISQTSEAETIQIMRNRILQNGSIPILDEGVYKHIFQESSKSQDREKPNPQPMKAIELLEECIHRTNQVSNVTINDQIRVLEEKITEISESSSPENPRKARLTDENKNALSKLKSELKKLQEIRSEEASTLQKLEKNRENFSRVTLDLYRISTKIFQNAKEAFAKNSRLFQKFKIRNAFLDSLERRLVENPYGCKLKIDKALVESSLPKKIVLNDEV